MNNMEMPVAPALLIEVYALGMDDGLLMAEQERDSEDMYDAAMCGVYSRRTCMPSASAPRRQPHSAAWREAKKKSMDRFIEILADSMAKM